MAQTSYPKTASVSYNATYGDRAVDDLTEKYGDFLERISTEDKVNLLAILATWQAWDTLYQGDSEEYNQHDLLETERLLYSVHNNVSEILEEIQDITDEASFGLMVAIANQLVSEQNS